MTASSNGTHGAPFGRLLTAMITPYTDDGAVDFDRAAELAKNLVEAGNDGLIITGTTGEGPVLTEERSWSCTV
jgi:4-hydroxy-tetrahydrodipicolinate synthase